MGKVLLYFFKKGRAQLLLKVAPLFHYQKILLVKISSFLAHPPQNDDPFKSFAKLNGNHILMTNSFKLHEYQTFDLMKLHKLFVFFIFPNFKLLLSKILCKNQHFFKWISKVLMKFYYVLLLLYFRSTNVWQWSIGPFKIFWNLRVNACKLFFLNKRNLQPHFLGCS